MKSVFLGASALLALSMIAAPAFADEITVSGEIAVVCDVTTPADVTTLDLTSAGRQALGNVNVKCNSYDGFDATISSENGGKLVSADSPSQFAYSLDYGAGPVSLASTYNISATQPGDTLSIAAAASAAGRNYGIAIEGISTTDVLYAGVYKDTITFTVDAR